MNKRQFFKFLFSGHRTLWLGITLASAITSLDGIVSPYIIGAVTNILSQRQFGQLPRILVLYLLLFLLLTLGSWLWQYLWAKVRQVANIKMRSTVVDNFLASPSEERMSQVTNFINVDAKQIENQFVNPIVTLVYCIEQAIFSLAYVLSINFTVSLIFLACGLLPFLVPRLTQKWVETGSSNWSSSYEQYNTRMNDAIHGFSTVTHLGVVAEFRRLVKKALLEEEKAYLTMNFRQTTASFLSQLTYDVSAVIALAIGVLFVVKGQVSVGGLISLFLASDRLTSPIITIAQVFNQLNAANPLIANTALEKPTARAFNNLTAADGATDAVLELRNCNLGYDKTILKAVNLTLNAKEKVLIVGRSGIGKSTLFKTILNELPLLAGKIVVAKSLQADLLEKVGIISQDTYIFSGTLRFNLTLGRKIADDKLVEVLKQVDLGYLAIPEHLNQLTGEKGLKLSGGEKRKLELARVLLAKRDVLLVDEALSGLDNKSANNIFVLLQQFPGTILEIEHAVSNEQREKYDQVIDLDEFAEK